MDDFKDAMFSYVTAILILSVIGVFETAKHWHLYAAVGKQPDLFLGLDIYLTRGDLLRASASLARIPLGYVIAIGIGFHFFLKTYFPSQRIWKICLVILVAGLISPLSRGPWVGAVALILTMVFFSRRKSSALVNLGAGAAAFVIVVSLTPLGSTLAGLIPFVGDTESATITYRQQLFDNSWIVINRNPLFGSVNYLDTPEMEAMRQGQGIIDVVNTYLGVALRYGFVGLSLFAGLFILCAWRVYRQFSAYRSSDPERFHLGTILLACLACIMIVIFTVSSVSVIPVIYWMILGMCSAYLNLDESFSTAGDRAEAEIKRRPLSSERYPKVRLADTSKRVT